jgi:hypothetical protein
VGSSHRTTGRRPSHANQSAPPIPVDFCTVGVERESEQRRRVVVVYEDEPAWNDFRGA